MTATVSVVIPAYNAAAFLAEAVRSALAQTLPPLEILVVDDGSTDETAAIARAFGGRVRCLSQENQGLSGARNRGIREARGDLIALLDADDSWLSEKLAAQVEALAGCPKAVACFSRTEYVGQDGAILRRSDVPPLHRLVEDLLLSCCVIGPPSAALIRRSALDAVGLFDPRFSQCADWDMWLRLAEAGPVVYADGVHVRYRVHGANMSKNVPLLERDTFGVLAKFFAAHPQPHYARLKDRCYSNHWMILAGSYFHAGRPWDSLRCLAHGLGRYPANVVRPLGLPGRWLKRRLRSRLATS
jgi:glycosyltransferase involved in cell wall biosynthesis